MDIDSFNEILLRFKKLHNSAMDLKEKLDLNLSIEIVQAYSKIFDSSFKELLAICPKEAFLGSALGQHAHFLNFYILKDQRQNCEQDLIQICREDIFKAQQQFINLVIENRIENQKIYVWQNLHPLIISISKKRFESNHFADSVEAAFKEINSQVKKIYKRKTKKEIDGDSLMRHAFATNESNNFNPIIHLADNSNKNGQNIQLGYMEIFAGSMKGIRNPKAHENLNVQPDEAWEMLVLASHLVRMIEKNNSRLQVKEEAKSAKPKTDEAKPHRI